jgi:ABC-2 type transport system ATP-binding protein
MHEGKAKLITAESARSSATEDKATESPGRSNESEAIRTSDLTKRFGEDVLAVDNLDLSVQHGQVFGLLGPNGAGKTTVLRMLLGLIRPTLGRAFLLGEEVRPSHPVLHRVGALVEGPAFVPHLSGLTNLEMWWHAGGQDLSESNLGEALEIAGLGNAIRRRVRTYSNGMRQRLAIAQVLLNRPKLLILDEPTVGLDPQEMREIRDMVTELASRGATILLSSHILAEVEQVCTHAAVMDRGRLVATGSVAELTSSTSSVYVEVDDRPAAMRLLEQMEGVRDTRLEGNGVSMTLVGVERKHITASLVAAGIGVQTIASRHTLEDAFFKIVEGAQP